MSDIKIYNFALLGDSDPSSPWAIFDVDLGKGTVVRNVSILDTGTAIHLSGIEASAEVREKIITAAMKESQRLS